MTLDLSIRVEILIDSLVLIKKIEMMKSYQIWTPKTVCFRIFYKNIGRRDLARLVLNRFNETFQQGLLCLLRDT